MSGAFDNKVQPLRKPVQCPSCGEKSARETYPFCSGRCAELDLHKWFVGSYAIAGNTEGDFDEKS